MKNFSMLIIYTCLLLGSCHYNYDEELCCLKIVRELQDCEEQNLHYTVALNTCSEIIPGEIVLPVLSKTLDTRYYNDLFFSVEGGTDTLYIFGQLSKTGHGNFSDGCQGYRRFLVREIRSNCAN